MAIDNSMWHALHHALKKESHLQNFRKFFNEVLKYFLRISWNNNFQVSQTEWRLLSQMRFYVQCYSKTLQKGGVVFEREKLDTCYVVPNFYRTPIPKYHFEMLLFNLVQALIKIWLKYCRQTFFIKFLEPVLKIKIN